MEKKSQEEEELVQFSSFKILWLHKKLQQKKKYNATNIFHLLHYPKIQQNMQKDLAQLPNALPLYLYWEIKKINMYLFLQSTQISSQ